MGHFDHYNNIFGIFITCDIPRHCISLLYTIFFGQLVDTFTLWAVQVIICLGVVTTNVVGFKSTFGGSHVHDHNCSWIYTYLIPTTVSSNPAHCELYSILHNLIKFVSDLR